MKFCHNCIKQNMQKIKNSTISLCSLCACFVSVVCTLYIMRSLQEIREIRSDIYKYSSKCTCGPILPNRDTQFKVEQRPIYKDISGNYNIFVGETNNNFGVIQRNKRQVTPLKKKECKLLRKKYKQQCKRKKKRKRKPQNAEKVQQQKSKTRTEKTVQRKGTSSRKEEKGNEVDKTRLSSTMGYFTTNLWKLFRVTDFDSNCIEGLGGTICRDYTYRTKNVHQILEFFLPTKVNDSSSPIEQKQDGVFTVKLTGIYIVFFHTSIYDSSIGEEIAAILLYRRGFAKVTKLSCTQSSNIPSIPEFYNKNHHACAITSVLYIEENDNIRIVLLKKNVKLDVSTNSTYFGVYLLSNS